MNSRNIKNGKSHQMTKSNDKLHQTERQLSYSGFEALKPSLVRQSHHIRLKNIII